MPKKKMTRYQANKQILEQLTKLVEKYPDWRFNQILSNTDVVLEGNDMFFDESIETLERLENSIIMKGLKDEVDSK